MEPTPSNIKQRPLLTLPLGMAGLGLATLLGFGLASGQTPPPTQAPGLGCGPLQRGLTGPWVGGAETPIGPVKYDIQTQATPTGFTMESQTGGQAVHTWRFQASGAVCGLVFRSTFGGGQTLHLTGQVLTQGQWRFDTAPDAPAKLRLTIGFKADEAVIRIWLRDKHHVRIDLRRPAEP